MNSTCRTSSSRQVGPTGLLLGGSAILFWSFGSSLVYLGAGEAGTWPFVAVGALLAGSLQLVFRRLYRGELRSALWLPWRLWVAPMSCFVLYGLAWPWALASSTSRQVFGVSLINYLWPILTVLFGIWWVPGVRLTPRIALATLLALSGLIVANLRHLRELISAAGSEPGGLSQFLPYALALMAAVLWAIYSALLARWRDWAQHYVTSPLGFLVIGLLAGAVVCSRAGAQTRLTPFGWWMIVLYGAGPLAAGYLFWEIALSRAKVQTLGMLAAATPVLSTVFLCIFLKTMPAIELVAAALLVGGAVLLTVRN